MTIPVSYAPLTVDNPLASNLAKYREEKFGTQEKLAEASGFKQSVISKWEAGKATPKPKSLLRLARALDVSIEALLLGVDPAYDLIRQPSEYESDPSKKDGADAARLTIDPELPARLAIAEAGIAQGLEEIEYVRAALEQALNPTQQRRAQRG